MAAALARLPQVAVVTPAVVALPAAVVVAAVVATTVAAHPVVAHTAATQNRVSTGTRAKSPGASNSRD